MKFSKFVGAGLALALSLGMASAATADGLANPISPEQRQFSWTAQKYEHSSGDLGGKVWMTYPINGGFSPRLGRPVIGALPQGSNAGVRLCDGNADCLSGEFVFIQALGALTLCRESNSVPCIEGFEFDLGDGEFKPATYDFTSDPAPNEAQIAEYLMKIPAENQPTKIQRHFGWKANAIPGLPASTSGPIVFHLPGATNSAGTDTYTLEAGYQWDGTASGGQVSDFYVTVHPVLVDQSKSARIFNTEFKLPDGRPWQGGQSAPIGIGDDVAYVDKSSVGWSAQFPAGLKLRVKLKLNSTLGGWFQGRVDSPNVSVDALDANTNLVTLSASPTSVPITAAEWPIFDPKYSAIYTGMGYNNWITVPAWREAEASGKGVFWDNPDGWMPRQGVAPINLMASLLGNKAKGSVSSWEFKRLLSTGPCLNDSSSLQGLLTTNAMTYQPDLPDFDGGLLSYKVAGLHYDANGKVFQGTYNFIMRDSVAKCLYGFKGNAPISGSVSVTSSDGTENVAYTNVSDKDGWLKLTAEGFTFSNPVISAKLTQAADPAPAPSPKPTASSTPGPSTPSVAKNITITCVKGKLVKKVTAVSPKCPAGYKKK